MKFFLLFLLFILVSSPSFSQWSTNPNVNNLVSSIPGNQRYLASCSDGGGGIIMVWEDNSGSNVSIFAQRFNVAGQPVWQVGGLRVCPNSFDQKDPAICTDADGGAIIYWVDYRTGGGFYDYYAQRIRKDGLLLWNTNGIKVNSLSVLANFFFVISYKHKCIPAEAGSSIVEWGSTGLSVGNLYTQKLDAYGNRSWNTNDVLLSSQWLNNFDLCLDGGKGAYYSWAEPDYSDVPSYNLFAQHVNALGIIQWSPRKTVCDELQLQFDPVMCDDQAGGFIVAWMDYRSLLINPFTGNEDVYAGHFNSAGSNLWALNGIPVCTEIHDQKNPVIVSDLHGGAHIFWSDYRNFSAEVRIYGQNISFNGLVRWTVNGKLFASRYDFFATNNLRYSPKIASVDALGGAVICWLGYQDVALTQYGLLAQKIDYYGIPQWDPDGIFVSTGNLKEAPSLVSDWGSGGCNIAWADARNGNFDIYAQHVKSNSALGNYKPKPVNSGVKDILSQNYPNPFNPTTNIAFSLVNDANVSIAIFDMSGRQLEVLTDGFLTAGEHSVTWNASNYASGTYFYKFTNGNHVEIKKMLLVK
ncbi:hypothetical protein BH10BAC5_BH10BAC5_09260 [soil metagenome]